MRKVSVEKHAIEEAKQWVDERLGKPKNLTGLDLSESPIMKN
jgi:hypothetical protein